MPRDRFGRTIDYLRVSVTEECNLRCTYCMPLDARPSSRRLSPDEIEQVVRAAVAVGFRKVRLTGGEPLVRPEIVEIVRRLAAIPELELVLTTNGMLLERLARPLREAGLRRVNVHLDSIDANALARSMRRGNLATILQGVAAAEEAGLIPVKLNSVVVRGVNEANVVDLAALTLDRPWHVRFVELMPVGSGECAQVATEGFVPTEETRARIEDALGPLSPLPVEPSADVRNHKLADAKGVVGFISPVTAPTCASCNRLRIAADGSLRPCLLSDGELSLRDALGDPRELKRRLLAAVDAKPAGSRLDELAPAGRRMHAIGG